MLLKAFSANLRSSIFVRSPFCGASHQISTIARSKLLPKSSKLTTVFYRSSAQYSKENAASNDSKQISGEKHRSISNQKETELSQQDIEILNQDPDSFGTLTSNDFKPLAANSNTQNESPPSIDSNVESEIGAAEEEATAKQSIQQYEATMKDLFEKGHVLEAIDLFEIEVLQKNRMHAPVHIYTWLIEECVRLNEFHKAISIYDQMIGRKLTVPFDTFEKLVVGFEQSNVSVGKLNAIQKVMAKNHIQPNASMYNAMIRIYARSTTWQTALTLADEMKTNRMPYQLETVNALFECLSHDKENGFYRLIELWHDMHHFDLTPDVSTFNGLLKCVKKCELTNVNKLKQLLDTIRMQCTTHPNENVIEDGRPNLLQDPPYIGFLFPLEQVERPEHRLLILGGLSNLLHEFKKYDVTPTIDTVTRLLEVVPNTFVAHQKVIALLNKHSIKPDLTIFNILLTKNCQTQKFRNALEIIEMMYAADIEVDLVSYGLLAMSCTNKNDAEEYFEQLKSKNVSVDVDILNAMLKNACALNDNDFVISILRKMKSQQIEPTAESIRMVDEYHVRVFRSLRSHRVVTKKMRNECFKLTRECRHWKKHFRNDEPKARAHASMQHVQTDKGKYVKRSKTPKSIDKPSKTEGQNEISPNE